MAIESADPRCHASGRVAVGNVSSASGGQRSYVLDGRRGIYRVTANGVRVTIGSAAITYGKGSAALKRHAGRDVLVMVDPDDISHCWAFTPDRDKRIPIGRMEANERIAPATCADDVREAIAEEVSSPPRQPSFAPSLLRNTEAQDAGHVHFLRSDGQQRVVYNRGRRPRPKNQR